MENGRRVERRDGRGTNQAMSPGAVNDVRLGMNISRVPDRRRSVRRRSEPGRSRRRRTVSLRNRNRLSSGTGLSPGGGDRPVPLLMDSSFALRVGSLNIQSRP